MFILRAAGCISFAVSCMLHSACCRLHAACCASMCCNAPCFLLPASRMYVACCMLFVVSWVLLAVCCLPLPACCFLFASCRLPRAQNPLLCMGGRSSSGHCGCLLRPSVRYLLLAACQLLPHWGEITSSRLRGDLVANPPPLTSRSGANHALACSSW